MGLGKIKVKNPFNVFKRADIDNPDIVVPEEVYNIRPYIFAVIAAFGAVISGYDTGFIGGTVTLTSFLDEFGLSEMTSTEKTNVNSNIISVFHVGAYFGALMVYPIGETFGRRIALNLSGFFLTFGAAISLISNKERGLGAIYAGRVLTGVGIGFCSSITPSYISEISPASIRGVLSGFWEIAWQLGGLVGYWINLGVSNHISDSSSRQWLVPFAIQLVPSAIFWIGVLFLPESPRWLVSKYKREKAEANLAFITTLPKDHEFIQWELSTMEESREAKKIQYGEGILKQFQTIFTSKKYLKRLLISTSTFAVQNSSGINAVTYYSVTVFQSIGLSGSSAKLLSTGLFGVIKTLAAVFWLMFIVDSWGRRSAFMIGCAPCGIAMWYLGAYIKIANPAQKLADGNATLDNAGKGALAMFYIWTFAYGATFNGTCWVYCAELYEQNVRGLVGSINASSNWFWAFIFARFTGRMFTAMGYGVYFLFAGCMTLAPIYIYCLYPETKGVPLEAVDYLFHVPAWRGHDYALSQIAKGKVEGEGEAAASEEDDVSEEKVTPSIEKTAN